jgi:hypothetical protein
LSQSLFDLALSNARGAPNRDRIDRSCGFSTERETCGEVKAVDRRFGLQTGELEATFDGTLVSAIDLWEMRVSTIGDWYIDSAAGLLFA